MKRRKISLALGTAIIAVSALAFSNAKTSIKDDILYWFDPSGNYSDYATIADEESRTGCSSGPIVCERGYTITQVDLTFIPPRLKITAIHVATIYQP